MKHLLLITTLIVLPAIAVLTTLSTHAFAQPTTAAAPQSHPALAITHLTGDCYVYTTYGLSDGQPYPANSMYLVTGKGVVMFDVPWDSTQDQPLLDTIEAHYHQKVVLCIATHYHGDRTAGLLWLAQHGIATWSSAMTKELCLLKHQDQADHIFTKDTTFTVGKYSFRTFYPGAGHTKDNIVIWLPEDRVLYGGCFVKSTAAPDLGYLGDADMTAYPVSVRRVMQAFPDPAFVIPGHLDWTGNQSLVHTDSLLTVYAATH